MKNLSKNLIWLLILLIVCPAVRGQQLKFSTRSSEAAQWEMKARRHLLNAEAELAYSDLDRALQADPNFAVAQFLKGTLAYGDSQKVYFDRAKQNVADKPEGEKLLVSLIDIKDPVSEQAVWDKLQKMYPQDPAIEFNYLIRTPDSAQLLNKMLGYIKKYPKEPQGYNIVAYLYLLYKKDEATAKTYFQKYIDVYPEGYNPYDSMGEFYYITGDMAQSQVYYTKSLEHYPFCLSSRLKLEEIKRRQSAAPMK